MFRQKIGVLYYLEFLLIFALKGPCVHFVVFLLLLK